MTSLSDVKQAEIIEAFKFKFMISAMTLILI